MRAPKIFQIQGKVIRYTIKPASWYFIHLDAATAAAVRTVRTRTVGFQSVPVEVTVGRTVWRTALFPTKDKLYLLALKAKVRQAESIREGDEVNLKFKLV